LCLYTGIKEISVIKGKDIAKIAAQIIDDRKGENVVLLDVGEISSVTDMYMIVTGLSTPHLKALYDEVQHTLKKDGVHCYRKTGDAMCGWLVLDYVDLVIHIFSKEAREYYAIEELWEAAPRLDIQSL
jgi:ribosome-associated protein